MINENRMNKLLDYPSLHSHYRINNDVAIGRRLEYAFGSSSLGDSGLHQHPDPGERHERHNRQRGQESVITYWESVDDENPTDEDDQEIGNSDDEGDESDFAEPREPHCHCEEAVQWGD